MNPELILDEEDQLEDKSVLMSNDFQLHSDKIKEMLLKMARTDRGTINFVERNRK